MTSTFDQVERTLVALDLQETPMTKTGQWIQHIGNLALVLGLLFVGFQLHQDRELKKAELVFTAHTQTSEIYVQYMGENPLKSWEQLIFHPENVSDYDVLVLDAAFAHSFTNYERGSSLERLGLWDSAWRKSLYTADFISPMGQRYLKARLDNEHNLLPQVEEYLRNFLDRAAQEQPTADYYELLRGEEYPRPNPKGTQQPRR